MLLASQVDRAFVNQNRGLLHELTGQLEILPPIMNIQRARLDDPCRARMSFTPHSRRCAVGARALQKLKCPAMYKSKCSRQTLPGTNLPLAPHVNDRFRLRNKSNAAARLLADAKRPLLFAGGGVISSEASEVMVRVAERLGSPVLTTGMGAGSISAEHPLWSGVAWIPMNDIRPSSARRMPCSPSARV